MIRYVALLRGINVGSHRVKMERLRDLFMELGFSDVSSYINSGNIFFSSEVSDKKQLTASIEQCLSENLGYEVPTFIRTLPELETILSQEPFKGVALTDDKRFGVFFTNEPIDTSVSLPQHSSKNDMDLVATNPYEAFVVWHIINKRPPSGKFASGIIPDENTSRFYHTLANILSAASK